MGRLLGWSDPLCLRGWAAVPIRAADVVPVLYCVAGGGCSTGYFDLVVDDAHPGYSMAEHLGRSGIAVVSFDHPGVGTSDPLPDLFWVTPTLLAQVHHCAASETLRRLRNGELEALGEPTPEIMAVGLGHSMGAMVTCIQQAHHRTFDALVLLGFGRCGLPEVLTEDELAAGGRDLSEVEGRITELARTRFGAGQRAGNRPLPRGTFFADDVPDAVRQAFARCSVPLLPVPGLTSMIPDSVRSQQEAIDVPTFLGFGSDDLIDADQSSRAEFPSSPETEVVILEGSGHCHNQAAGRQLLWDRIAEWVWRSASGHVPPGGVPPGIGFPG